MARIGKNIYEKWSLLTLVLKSQCDLKYLRTSGAASYISINKLKQKRNLVHLLRFILNLPSTNVNLRDL